MSNKVYEIITEKIMNKLEAGVIPWHQPWINQGAPKNLVTKKEYKGINIFLLACQKYVSPYWLSFKQVKELGGSVIKGEKATMVIFWKQIKIKEKTDNGEEIEKTIPFLRYYNVFNTEQTEGIPEEKIPGIDNTRHFKPIEHCDHTINNMPDKPNIQSRDCKAYYSPSEDIVNMPKGELFNSEQEYYSTLFHELTHSTGHEKRVGRRLSTEVRIFGNCDYSKEELVAEMGAAFLCGHCAIDNKTIDNSASYINGWLNKLRGDKKLVVMAAAQAQKAADFILNSK